LDYGKPCLAPVMIFDVDERANGLRYLRVGGRGQGLGAGKTRSLKMPQNPHRPLHAVLARFWIGKLQGFWANLLHVAL